MCDGQSNEIENARFFFKDIEYRNNTMLTIIHQYTNYVIASLAIIWGFIITNISPSSIFIGVIFTNVILLFWRYFAHSIDNNIAKTYSKLIYLEYICFKKEPLPDELTILDGLTNSPAWSDQWKKEIKNREIDKKIEIVNCLTKNRRIGYRGHDLFDNFVECISIILFSILLAYLLSNNVCLLIMTTIIGITIYSVAFIHLIENYQQKDSVDSDIKKAFNC